MPMVPASENQCVKWCQCPRSGSSPAANVEVLRKEKVADGPWVLPRRISVIPLSGGSCDLLACPCPSRQSSKSPALVPPPSPSPSITSIALILARYSQYERTHCRVQALPRPEARNVSTAPDTVDLHLLDPHSQRKLLWLPTWLSILHLAFQAMPEHQCHWLRSTVSIDHS